MLVASFISTSVGSIILVSSVAIVDGEKYALGRELHLLLCKFYAPYALVGVIVVWIKLKFIRQSSSS